MTVRARVLLLTLAASCKSSSSTTAAPATKQAPASAAPTAPSHASGDDVGPIAAKTDTGGEVIGIGEPRLQLADGNFLGGLVLRAKAGLAAAEDARTVTLWDLATGEVVRRIDPLPELNPIRTTFALSHDGNWLITGSARKTRLFKRPFENVEMKADCADARAFSHDDKLFVCHSRLPEVWSIAEHKLVAKAPDAALPFRSPQAVDFSTDDQSLYWGTDHEIVRWDFVKGGATTTIYKSTDTIAKVAFSECGNVAFVSTRPTGSYKFASVLVDLATGQSSSPSDGYNAAVSPAGARVAYVTGNSVKVVDAGTSKEIWSTKDSVSVQRVAFGSDDVVGYVSGNQLHVVDLAKGPRTYEAPSRFVGWVSHGVAAIERKGKLEQLGLSDKSWSAADRAALAIKPPAGAPSWATWNPFDAAIAAEPSARHEASPDSRGATPCMPKLRVWTAKGGEKSLAMTCTKGDDAVDPGWDVGGTVAVAVRLTAATVFDATTGKKTGTIAVDRPRIDKPKFARSFWMMAVAPNGMYLALVSAGPQLPPEGTGDPREDALHADEFHDSIDCEMDLSGECKLDYLLTVYSLTGTPTQVRKLPVAKPTSLAFDRTGKRPIVGTAAGEIDVVSPTGNDEPRVEHFHHGAITRIVPAPDDHWVFSEDAAGQQRLWPLPP